MLMYMISIRLGIIKREKAIKLGQKGLERFKVLTT